MRLEMLQVARLAPNLLHEARDLVADFVKSQFHTDGGFTDRAGDCDLYYTVFGIECLLALREDLPADAIKKYLETFGDGTEPDAGRVDEDGEVLDFIHLGCLARCWAALAKSPAGAAEFLSLDARKAMAARIEKYRAGDGGYSQNINAETGTVYGCFVALAMYQDLGLPLSDEREAKIVSCIQSQRAKDGGYANGHDFPIGTTPTTAAAVTALRVLNQPADEVTGQWLISQEAGGGFLAMPDAPMPDLLSLAVALHALSGLHVSIDSIKERCLDFVDSLWVNKGSFFGNWSEDMLDVEYTFYGLLALGHLAV